MNNHWLCDVMEVRFQSADAAAEREAGGGDEGRKLNCANAKPLTD